MKESVFMGMSYVVVSVMALAVVFVLIGLVLKFRKDKRAKEESKEHKTSEPKDFMSDFKKCLLVLLADVMQADGVEHKKEFSRVKSTISRYYKTQEEQNAAFSEFRTILKNNYNTTIICSIINRRRFDQNTKVELIMELYALAYADGVVTKEERAEIEKIASLLRFDNVEINNIFACFMEKYNQGYYRVEQSEDEGEE